MLNTHDQETDHQYSRHNTAAGVCTLSECSLFLVRLVVYSLSVFTALSMPEMESDQKVLSRA